ncbi:MAG: PAS domain S-box protein [Jaaginema sp. PMC 1078.18]|nr:PAS domain S-box protein [Jaaginema sp. PMC 1078.18]
MVTPATILQNMLDGDRYLVVAIDLQYNLIFSNARAPQNLNILGGQSLAVGDNLQQYLAQIPENAEILAYWQQTLAGEKSQFTQEVRTSGQTVRYYEVNLMPLWEGEAIAGAMAVATEVTAGKQRENQLAATVNETAVQLEQEARERSIAQKLLADRNRILKDIARDRPLSQVLEAIALTLETYLEEAICVIMLLNPRKTALVHGAAPHFPKPLKNSVLQGIIPSPQAGSCGTAAYRQEPAIVTDIRTDPLWESDREAVLAYDLQSCWSFPIFDSQGELLGTLAMYYSQKRQPLATEWKLVEQMLDLTSIAIENRQNKRSLQDREDYLHRALLNAPFPILIHAEDGEIVLVNRMVSSLTGYDRAAIPTIAAWTAKVYGDRQDAVRSQIADLYSLDSDSPVEEGEFELRSREGLTLTWTFRSASLGMLPDGRRVVISMANDVTERKKLETELSRREARLQRLFHSDMIGIGEWDISGKIVDANATLLQLLGYDRADLEAGAIDWYALTPQKYVAADRQALAEIQESGVSHPYEKEFRDRHGKLTPVLVGSCSLETPTRGFFFAVDISKRKALERSLQQSIQRLENLRSLDLAILALQSIDDIVREACDRLEKLFDFSKVNLVIVQLNSETARWLNTPTATTPTPDELTQLRSLMQGAAQSDRYCIVGDREQYPGVLPPDPNCHSFVGISICANDKCFGLLFLWCDPVSTIQPQNLEIALEISNQIAIACQQELLNHELQSYTKELENRVAHRTAQLQEINRELEAFTYSVSHDLRAPLRAIQGFSTALHEDYINVIDDVGCSYLQRLNQAAQKLDRLIQDLLSYSRLSRTEIQFKNLNLEHLIQNIIHQLSLEIKERNAKITISQPLAWVYSNPTILQQILVNIIQNALKFVASEVQPHIHIYSETTSDRLVRLWIEDNGIGIDPEHQERIFTLFERLHGSESYTGTGIGLALVSKCIERLRGQVGVESHLGGGSRFWLEIPMSDRGKNR